MAFDEDDERPDLPSGPLPPEDRLWRHPSELGAAGAAAPTPLPLAATASEPAEPRRALRLAVLASACLTGAVAALAITWMANPPEEPRSGGRELATESTGAATFSAPTSWPDLAAAAAPGLVAVRSGGPDAASGRHGVGLALGEGAVLVPATLAAAPDLSATDDDGRAEPATLLAADPSTGVAVVLTALGGATPRWRTSTVEPGEPVGIVALEVAGAEVPAATVERASVAATDRRATLDGALLHGLVVLDRPLPEEAEGALVIDVEGRAVGTVVATSHHDGVALVAPAAAVLAAADELLADGRIRRPWLGVRAGDAAPDATPGAVLTRVSAGSPAAAAGLQVGDLVVGVDELTVTDASDLVLALRTCEPGQSVLVHIERSGERLPVPVRLGG